VSNILFACEVDTWIQAYARSSTNLAKLCLSLDYRPRIGTDEKKPQNSQSSKTQLRRVFRGTMLSTPASIAARTLSHNLWTKPPLVPLFCILSQRNIFTLVQAKTIWFPLNFACNFIVGVALYAQLHALKLDTWGDRWKMLQDIWRGQGLGGQLVGGGHYSASHAGLRTARSSHELWPMILHAHGSNVPVMQHIEHGILGVVWAAQKLTKGTCSMSTQVRQQWEH